MGQKSERKNPCQHWTWRLMPMLHQCMTRKSPIGLIPKANCRLWMNGTRCIGAGLKMNKKFTVKEGLFNTCCHVK